MGCDPTFQAASDLTILHVAVRYPDTMAALMQRYDGHPYEKYDMLPYNIVDPTKPEGENVWNMGYNMNELVRLLV